MRLGLDLDGVVADARAETRYRFIQEFGKDAWEPVKTHLHTSNAPGVPDGWMRAQFEDPIYWLNMRPFADGWLMANKWFAQGHDVFIVTARHPSEMEWTEQWLEQWDIIVNDVISQPLGTKHEVVNNLYLDIFVEDHPEDADTIGKYATSFLIDAPYNQHVNVDRAVRVKSLWDVDKVVDSWETLKSSAINARSIAILQSLTGAMNSDRMKIPG